MGGPPSVPFCMPGKVNSICAALFFSYSIFFCSTACRLRLCTGTILLACLDKTLQQPIFHVNFRTFLWKRVSCIIQCAPGAHLTVGFLVFHSQRCASLLHCCWQQMRPRLAGFTSKRVVLGLSGSALVVKCNLFQRMFLPVSRLGIAQLNRAILIKISCIFYASCFDSGDSQNTALRIKIYSGKSYFLIEYLPNHLVNLLHCAPETALCHLGGCERRTSQKLYAATAWRITSDGTRKRHTQKHVA